MPQSPWTPVDESVWTPVAEDAQRAAGAAAADKEKARLESQNTLSGMLQGAPDRLLKAVVPFGKGLLDTVNPVAVGRAWEGVMNPGPAILEKGRQFADAWRAGKIQSAAADPGKALSDAASSAYDAISDPETGGRLAGQLAGSLLVPRALPKIPGAMVGTGRLLTKVGTALPESAMASTGSAAGAALAPSVGLNPSLGATIGSGLGTAVPGTLRTVGGGLTAAGEALQGTSAAQREADMLFGRGGARPNATTPPPSQPSGFDPVDAMFETHGPSAEAQREADMLFGRGGSRPTVMQPATPPRTSPFDPVDAMLRSRDVSSPTASAPTSAAAGPTANGLSAVERAQLVRQGFKPTQIADIEARAMAGQPGARADVLRTQATPAASAAPPVETTGVVPEEGVKPPPPVIDPEAQAVRDQTAATPDVTPEEPPPKTEEEISRGQGGARDEGRTTGKTTEEVRATSRNRFTGELGVKSGHPLKAVQNFHDFADDALARNAPLSEWQEYVRAGRTPDERIAIGRALESYVMGKGRPSPFPVLAGAAVGGGAMLRKALADQLGGQDQEQEQ